MIYFTQVLTFLKFKLGMKRISYCDLAVMYGKLKPIVLITLLKRHLPFKKGLLNLWKLFGHQTGLHQCVCQLGLPWWLMLVLQVVASQFRFRPSVANSQLSWGQPRGQNCLECPDFGEGVNQTQS